MDTNLNELIMQHTMAALDYDTGLIKALAKCTSDEERTRARLHYIVEHEEEFRMLRQMSAQIAMHRDDTDTSFMQEFVKAHQDLAAGATTGAEMAKEVISK